MKSLVFFALSVVASAAMATGPVPSTSAITIGGSSTQATTISDSIVKNKADGMDSQALQNIASNAGNITINGTSDQNVLIKKDSSVSNEARKNAIAQQNLASNVGAVTVTGKSTQKVTIGHSTLDNFASTNSIAQQSLSTNVGSVTIGSGGSSTQTTSLYHSGVYNSAYGDGSKAVQNISSNNSCSTFTCANAPRNSPQ